MNFNDVDLEDIILNNTWIVYLLNSYTPSMTCCDDSSNDMQCWDGLVTSARIYSNNHNYVPKWEFNLVIKISKGNHLLKVKLKYYKLKH